MTYRDYMRGDELILSIAPTGHREPDDQTKYLPFTPDDIATAVSEAALQGATIAHLHGRRDDGVPEPKRLPAVARAVRERTDDILIEYDVGPEDLLGDYLDVIDDGPYPDIAQVRIGPDQYGHRGVQNVSRRDVDRLLAELDDRGIEPNLLVTNGRELNEVTRLISENRVDPDPLLTLKLGPRSGTVATPQMLLALLDAVPTRATTIVSASGPNQFPLTSLAAFNGAHVRTGMEDNLYLQQDDPVQNNAQLVQRVADVTAHSLREFATVDAAREIISLSAKQRDISA